MMNDCRQAIRSLALLAAGMLALAVVPTLAANAARGGKSSSSPTCTWSEVPGSIHKNVSNVPGGFTLGFEYRVRSDGKNNIFLIGQGTPLGSMPLSLAVYAFSLVSNEWFDLPPIPATEFESFIVFGNAVGFLPSIHSLGVVILTSEFSEGVVFRLFTLAVDESGVARSNWTNTLLTLTTETVPHFVKGEGMITQMVALDDGRVYFAIQVSETNPSDFYIVSFDPQNLANQVEQVVFISEATQSQKNGVAFPSIAVSPVANELVLLSPLNIIYTIDVVGKTYKSFPAPDMESHFTQVGYSTLQMGVAVGNSIWWPFSPKFGLASATPDSNLVLVEATPNYSSFSIGPSQLTDSVFDWALSSMTSINSTSSIAAIASAYHADANYNCQDQGGCKVWWSLWALTC